MQRLLDALLVAFYVAMIAAIILVGLHAIVVLDEMSKSLKQDRINHEQMLKDHVRELKDHERLMERHTGP
jgi:biopolymer transport protein ExbB/TolQ